jgi:hypothetical protein
MNLDELDPTFVDDLQASQAAVWRVAQWLTGCGNTVTVRAVRVRPTAAEWSDYTDNGDLELVQRCEIKQRRLAFTSHDDFPFDEIIVDTARKWDTAHPKPWRYFILNAAGTVAIVLDGTSAKHWHTRTVSHRGRDQVVYTCPLDRVRFITITNGGDA